MERLTAPGSRGSLPYLALYREMGAAGVDEKDIGVEVYSNGYIREHWVG